MKRIGKGRRRTRHIFQKTIRKKGKISISKYFQPLKDGDKVLLNAESAIQKGLYFPRFHGRTGEVIGKQGNCYMIKIHDKNKAKSIIVHPVHLRRLQS
ncbi:MAG: 50S ribosomal protein L21e [Candidatus Woesearchaeota archaeon]